MSAKFCGEIRGLVTDEERRRHRDQMSDEERRELMEKSYDHTMQRLFSGGDDSRFRPLEARMDQLEKRLEILELKK